MSLSLLYLLSSNFKWYFIGSYLDCFGKKEPQQKKIIWNSWTMFAKEIILFGLVPKANKSSAAKQKFCKI